MIAGGGGGYGYSGGGAGAYLGAGGGGGSLDSGLSQALFAGLNAGNGCVTIAAPAVVTTVPEPAELLQFAAGLLGLASPEAVSPGAPLSRNRPEWSQSGFTR